MKLLTSSTDSNKKFLFFDKLISLINIVISMCDDITIILRIWIERWILFFDDLIFIEIVTSMLIINACFLIEFIIMFFESITSLFISIFALKLFIKWISRRNIDVIDLSFFVFFKWISYITYFELFLVSMNIQIANFQKNNYDTNDVIEMLFFVKIMIWKRHFDFDIETIRFRLIDK